MVRDEGHVWSSIDMLLRLYRVNANVCTLLDSRTVANYPQRLVSHQGLYVLSAIAFTSRSLLGVPLSLVLDLRFGRDLVGVEGMICIRGVLLALVRTGMVLCKLHSHGNSESVPSF